VKRIGHPFTKRPSNERFAAGAKPVLAIISSAVSPQDAGMIDVLRFVGGVLAGLIRGRAALLAENALLRQQLIAARRKIEGRVRWAPWLRVTMALATRLAPAWRTVILLVQPATVLRWHRAG
jgi:hypothetical protein